MVRIFKNIGIGNLLMAICRCSSLLQCCRCSMSDVYIGRTLDVMYRRARNECFTCCLSDRMMAVLAVFLTVHRLHVFSIMCSPRSTRVPIYLENLDYSWKFVNLENSWKTRGILCYNWKSCLSISTTAIQRHKLLRHHKVRTAQVCWLNLLIELATIANF